LHSPNAELKVGLHTPHPDNLALHYMRASIKAVCENLGKPSAFPRDVDRVELLSLHERGDRSSIRETDLKPFELVSSVALTNPAFHREIVPRRAGAKRAHAKSGSPRDAQGLKTW
jgi:hypothetical protein